VFVRVGLVGESAARTHPQRICPSSPCWCRPLPLGTPP